MKLSAILILFFAISNNASGQSDTSVAKTDLSKMVTQKDVYLQKSRAQKTMAFVILGIGTTTLVTGCMMVGTAKNNDFIIPTDKKTYDGAGLIVLGFLVDLSSIPFFIASSNSKEKAMTFAIKNEPIPRELIARVKQHSIPTLSAKWKF